MNTLYQVDNRRQLAAAYQARGGRHTFGGLLLPSVGCS